MARNFISWLFGQAHLRHIGERDDLVSDIAYDVHRDVNFPKSAKRAAQRDYLSRYGDHVLEAWDAARDEYRHLNRLAKMARLARGARVDR
jgi:predicted LPLAT superfamily acyltransferase